MDSEAGPSNSDSHETKMKKEKRADDVVSYRFEEVFVLYCLFVEEMQS